ncbi:hypothetical protein FJT64_017824 [Amphibalanus amphitrite]|uniref:Uncharacterized protein n=1 Tax=Amphibalanus amphitrite TaxID=1232801 RepID=A0A6A4X5H3_AMPAM|nr:hypothetical protein FJT64_017824 [Amphibalanus amphitrite]
MVGNLQVNPQYLVVQPRKARSLEASGPITQEQWDAEAVKLYIILAAVAALILLAIIQAACTLARNRRAAPAARQPKPTAKDKLITNSAWRDMAAHSNYGYESYEADAATNGRPSKGGRGAPAAAHAPSPPQMVETRSLQRPRSGPPPGGDRSTYSLPRPGSQFSAATYHPSGERRSATLQRGAGGPEAAPDFYFMPSQRKYSGEVVRVYVDYSKQQ